MSLRELITSKSIELKVHVGSPNTLLERLIVASMSKLLVSSADAFEGFPLLHYWLSRLNACPTREQREVTCLFRPHRLVAYPHGYNARIIEPGV